MQYAQFVAQLQDVKPVYYLKGDDYWAAKALKDLCLLADPNEVSVYTPLDDYRDAMWALNSFPMFGALRVVVIQDAPTIAESDKKAFSAYCEAPSLGSVLVFYRTGWAPKGAEECNFDHLKGDALVSYVSEVCASRSIRADRSAISLLVDYCGEDVAKIEAELTKLQAYLGDACLDEAAVKAVVAPDPNYQIYAFTDQVLKGSYVGALRVLDHLSNGNDQASFLGLIINHYRRAFYGKISGLAPAELGKLLGNAKPYVITKAVESVRRYSAVSLMGLLQKLYRLEYDFKSGRMGAEEALQLAIAEAIERRNV